MNAVDGGFSIVDRSAVEISAVSGGPGREREVSARLNTTIDPGFKRDLLDNLQAKTAVARCLDRRLGFGRLLLLRLCRL